MLENISLPKKQITDGPRPSIKQEKEIISSLSAYLANESTSIRNIKAT
jgi:hypothetical protein